MANNLGKWGKQAPQAIRENEEREDALEAYFLEHVPGLKEHHAARDEAFRQIEDKVQRRHPDPTPEDLSRFQRGGQRMLSVIPSCGLVRDADHGR
jgi:hypothetical protein